MGANLNTTLQELRQAISADALVVLEFDALESEFHGLTPRQLVTLTDAPVLAVRRMQRNADMGSVEQFVVDGTDEGRCELAARQLILADGSDLAMGSIREVRIVRGNARDHGLVLDHNGIVYRVTDEQAAVDRDLTAEVRRRRQAAAAGNGSPSVPRRPAVIADGVDWREVAGEVLHGLSAVRVRNGVAVREIEKLVASCGEQTLEAACEVVDPGTLCATLDQIASTARQIDVLVDAIAQRMRMLLHLAEPLEDGGEATATGGDGGAARFAPPPVSRPITQS